MPFLDYTVYTYMISRKLGTLWCKISSNNCSNCGMSLSVFRGPGFLGSFSEGLISCYGIERKSKVQGLGPWSPFKG